MIAGYDELVDSGYEAIKHDIEYKKNRERISEVISSYDVMKNEIDYIPYSEDDEYAYKQCMQALIPLWRQYAEDSIQDTIDNLL